MRKLKGFS